MRARLGFLVQGPAAHSVGLFDLSAEPHPDSHSGPTSDYMDIGLDAAYRFLGTRRHIFPINLERAFGPQMNAKNAN